MSDPLLRWQERQSDFANLFNPAFIAVILREMCASFESKAKQPTSGMPYALIFPAVPLGLSPRSQQELPARTTTRLVSWLRDRPQLRVHLAEATRSLTPVIREGAIVALSKSLIRIEAGCLYPAETLRSRDGSEPERNLDLSVYLSRAAFVGGWLAASGSVASIYEAIGVRP